jgi:hypothetical protein
MLNKLFKKRVFSEPLLGNLEQRKDLIKKIVYYSTDKGKYVMADIPINITIYNNYENENKYDIFEEIYNEYIKNSDSSQHNHSLNKIEESDEIYDFDSINYMDDDLYSIIKFNK